MKKQICWSHKNRLNTQLSRINWIQSSPIAPSNEQHVYKETDMSLLVNRLQVLQTAIQSLAMSASTQYSLFFRVLGNLEVTLDSCPGTGHLNHSKMPCMHALMLGAWLKISLRHWRRSIKRLESCCHNYAHLQTRKPKTQKDLWCLTEHDSAFKRNMIKIRINRIHDTSIIILWAGQEICKTQF